MVSRIKHIAGRNMIPLSMVTEGEKVKIKSIDAGRRLRKRLYDLGLVENATIEVIKNEFSGPMILKILDSRVILGRGHGHKIFVETQ